ncbi:toxin-antitoxin system YwqK family antitoxin [Rufibacter sp. DG15C]|uniref:toxin-antitoxin system YwqK family antitoxin n=1 Tax=Rufibacter sp. DG15C TaxID=1379909 RepID=UPI000A5ADFBD|nr:hypothetical protein [Rufibacter sp. DG15C]
MSPKKEEVKDVDQNGWVRTKGTLVNGHRQGYFEDFYKNGVLRMAANWEQGQIEGNYSEYFTNGNLKVKGVIVDGQLNGPNEKYDSLGNSSWVMYANGEKTGVEELKDKTRIITDKIYYSEEGGHILYQEKLTVLEDVKERILFPVLGDNDNILKLGIANLFTIHLVEAPVCKVTMVIGKEDKQGAFTPIGKGTSKDNKTFTYIFKPNQSGPGVLSFKMVHSKSPQDKISVADGVFQFEYDVE